MHACIHVRKITIIYNATTIIHTAEPPMVLPDSMSPKDRIFCNHFESVWSFSIQFNKQVRTDKYYYYRFALLLFYMLIEILST